MKLRVWNGKEIIEPELFCLRDNVFYNTSRDFIDGIYLENCIELEYIGKQDKWGDDIYVGDVVERLEKDCRGIETSGFYQIVKEDFSFRLKAINSQIIKKDAIIGIWGELNVLGNIYEQEYLLLK